MSTLHSASGAESRGPLNPISATGRLVLAGQEGVALSGKVLATYIGHRAEAGQDHVSVMVHLSQALRPAAPYVKVILAVGTGVTGMTRADQVRAALPRGTAVQAFGEALSFCLESNALRLHGVIGLRLPAKVGDKEWLVSLPAVKQMESA